MSELQILLFGFSVGVVAVFILFCMIIGADTIKGRSSKLKVDAAKDAQQNNQLKTQTDKVRVTYNLDCE